MRAVKMAIYGFCVSAPLSHFLVGQLQKAFAGKTGLKAKLTQLIANNLLVAPIQTSGGYPYTLPYVSLLASCISMSLNYTLVNIVLLTLHTIISAYLASMAIINGAKSVDEVMKTVKAGFFSVIRVRTLPCPFP